MKKWMRGFVALFFAAALLSFSSAQSPFEDVPPTHWAYQAIQKAVAKGILEGYPGNVFLGKRPITRYEAAMIVSRLIDAIEQATGKTIIKEESGKVNMKGLANESWVKEHFGSKEEFEQFKETVNKLAVEFQDELEALKVRVADLEGRVDKVEKKVDLLGNVKISGEIQWRAWRGASEPGQIFIRNRGGSSSVDQWAKLNVSAKDKDYDVGVSLWNRNWNCGFFCRADQRGIVQRSGFGQEGGNQMTIAEAYVKTKTEIGTFSIGRQKFQWGPVGLLMSYPLMPQLPGVATWEYDLDQLKVMGFGSIVPNSGSDRVLAGRVEYKLKKENAVVGVTYEPFGTGDSKNNVGVDIYLPIQKQGAVYAEYARWDRDIPGFNASDNFVVGVDWNGGSDRYLVSVKFADIDQNFNNIYTVNWREDTEGIYRAGFTGVGLSGMFKVTPRWTISGDVNKGDNNSRTGWGRGTVAYKVNDHVTAALTGIQFGISSGDQSLLRGEVKVKF